ncbi:MAG TPA: hypothetical protein VGH33_27840 [Isosphaeraceae bacterium]
MTAPLHRLALGLGLAFSASPALAQTKAEATKEAPAERRPDAAFSPLGDPSRFTRMGGWGGLGSGMAQFGLGKAMLLSTPAVQKELKLSDEQKKALKEWEDGLRKRGETMFRRQAQAAEPADANNPGQPGEAAQAQQGGPPNPLAMLEMVTTLVREGESSLAKVLDKRQLARLNQIALQMEGVAALARPEVAEAIYLSPEQVAEIQEILNGAKGQQMGLFVRQGLAMRDRRDAAPDAAKPQSAVARPDETKDDPEAQAKRRQAQRERMRAEFTRFRDSSDQIQDAATAKILRVLDKTQRGRFEKLLGEPFDPAKLAGPGGFGGPRRPDAETAETETAAAPKPSEAAPARSSRLRDSRFKGEPKSQP